MGFDWKQFSYNPAGAAFDDLKGRIRGDSPETGQLGEQYAALTRQMWSDYVTQFVPYENRLIDYATSQTAVGDSMKEASGFVDKSFTAQRGATDRRLRGLGLQLDADEQKATDESYGLAKSLADVTAQNVAGQKTRSRQQSILGNPAPTAGSIAT